VPRDPVALPDLPSLQDPSFLEIRGRVLHAGGIDIALYKDRSVLRRLAARLRAAGVADLGAYCRRLDADPGELRRLVEALTVNVSEFFRNPRTFRVLTREVLPVLVGQRQAARGRSIRVWSAGCATGEEPYSLAITFSEYLGDRLGEFPVVIYATDVDGPSLAAARAARYRMPEVIRVPRHVLRRYFEPDAAGYRVRQTVRRMVHFRRHDLLAPPPFRRMDLAVCRNVFIYMTRPFQERVLAALYDVLNPGGFLVLGKVEGLTGPARERFEVVNLAERIYRKPVAAWPRPSPAARQEFGA
jgi:chemotaxis protein methyltransferase CheR